MTDSEKYNVNFFKPLSDHAKANTRLIIILATIWFVAVFGFQFLLMALNEPTPENSYTTFQEVWPQVVENTDSTCASKQELAKTFLYVLGKNVAVKPDHKMVLKNALSRLVFTMVPDSLNGVLKEEPGEESLALVKETIGLTEAGFGKLMIDLLPTSIVKVEGAPISEECITAIPGIMELYLVHNQNALTDFQFLGFPFHYWYTAQFLLILFVVLCLIYAVLIDRSNEKFDFVEET
ncbi:MAG: DUF4212 domain-containing protein [Bacteroidetes bacterium]|nr:DUF4212 domain-containing protein [Bacteroidota bacterium]